MAEKCSIDPSRDCLALTKADALEKELGDFKAGSRETHKEIFERLNKLETGTAAMNEKFSAIMDKLDTLTAKIEPLEALPGKVEAIDKLAEKVEVLEAKPGKRWEGIVDKIISLVVGAVVGYVLVKFGL